MNTKEKIIARTKNHHNATQVEYKGSTLLHWGDSTAYAWVGRGTRPSFVIELKKSRFETMDEIITAFKAKVDRVEKFQNAHREERKDLKRKMAQKIKPGTVLYWTGGYDQTNVDFYIVSAKKSQFRVVVQKLRYIRDNEDHVMPDLNSSTANIPEEVGTITAYGVKIGTNTFRTWDGESLYATSPYNLR